MANLPIVGNSENTWGTDLNNFLTVTIEPSGTAGGKLKTTALDSINFTGTISMSGSTIVGLPANTSIGNVSATEISYLDNSTSNIQNQINTHTSATSAHGITGALVGTLDAQILINKTLTSPKINSTTNVTASGEQLNILTNGSNADSLHTHNIATSAGNSGYSSDSDKLDGQHGSYYATASNLTTHTVATSAHGTTSGIVGVSDTQSLSNKTLLSPKINSITNIVVTGEEINFVSGSVDYIQTQLNNKSATTHTHVLSAGGTDLTATATEINQALTGKGASVTANTLTELTSGGYDASNLHLHDNRYNTKTELTSGAISTVLTTPLTTNMLVVSNSSGKITTHTIATSANLTTLVAGSASNADSLHMHTLSADTSATSGSFGVVYQTDVNNITLITISSRCVTTAASGLAYIEVKSDSSPTPTTIIATSGIQLGLVGEDNTFTTTFVVKKGYYYKIDKTETNGTVTTINWVANILKVG